MRSLQQLRLLPASLFQFTRFPDRRHFRRLASTSPSRTRCVRGRPRRGCGGGGRSCDCHGVKGGRRFGLGGWRENFPPLLDEPLEDQPDDGTTMWSLPIRGGSQ